MWYRSSWRDLRRRSNAGHGLLNKPEITPPSHSNHLRAGTDADDGRGLGEGGSGVPGGALPAGRQGPKRPSVPRSGALLLRSQHHLARPAGRVRELEFHLEALLALEPD